MNKKIQGIKLVFKGVKEVHSIHSSLWVTQIMYGVFQTFLPFINIYMSARIITAISSGNAMEDIIQLALITVVLNGVVTLFMRGALRLTNIKKAEFRVAYKMWVNNKIYQMDYMKLEKHDTHLHKQKILDYNNVNGMGIWRVFLSFSNMLSGILGVILSVSLTYTLFTTTEGGLDGIQGFVASPTFSGIIILVIIANILISMTTEKKVVGGIYKFLSGSVGYNRILGFYLNELLPNYETGKDIRLYKQQDIVNEDLKSCLKGSNTQYMKYQWFGAKYRNITIVVSGIMELFIYIFVGLKALMGLFSVGYIVQYVGSINQFSNSLRTVMAELMTLKANNEALKLYFDFMEIESEFQGGSYVIEELKDEIEIEFRDVSFRYPDSDIMVLKHVNATIQGNKKTAIVGMNGSGKSTFIKLMARLYDPTEGQILLNGVDIKEYDYEAYHRFFSVVFQDFKLFSFSVGENISGDISYYDEKVAEQLKKVGLEGKFESLPRGYHTCLYKDFEEDGIEVSGGEAQKIAMARALYKDASIILLDEPTAALDPIAENEIYTKFNELMGDKMAIFISHRLSSCKFCDDIIVMHQGEIIQRGNHKSLVADVDGKYFEMWDVQAQHYL